MLYIERDDVDIVGSKNKIMFYFAKQLLQTCAVSTIHNKVKAEGACVSLKTVISLKQFFIACPTQSDKPQYHINHYFH